MSRLRAVRTGDAVREYQTKLLRRERSVAHQQGYAQILGVFLQAFGESTYMHHLTATDVENFFYGGTLPATGKPWRGMALKLNGGKVAGSTWNRRRQLMTKFFADMATDGLCEPGLMANVDEKKTSSRDFIWLSPEEVAYLLDHPDLPTRDMAMLTVAMDHALRSAELKRILIGDYDIDKGLIKLKITKSKSRELQLEIEAVTPDCARRLHRWLVEYAMHFGLTLSELLAHKDWQLFPYSRPVPIGWNTKGKMTSYRTLIRPNQPCAHPNLVVHGALALLGFTPAETKFNGIHCARRSAVNNATKARGIRAGQALARHASEKTTEGYLNVTEAKLSRDEWRRKGGGWRAEAQAPATVTSIEERRKRASG